MDLPFPALHKYGTMIDRYFRYWGSAAWEQGCRMLDAAQSIIGMGNGKLEQLRLDKIIAAQGEYSRRDVKRLAARGAVTVNGRVVKRTEEKIDPDRDQVCVNGRALMLRAHVYIMLNKPQGVVSASRDQRERTVVDLVPDQLKRKGLFPAGRLDKDTTGFVLITDDGELAHRLLSPKNHVPKTYVAVLDRPIQEKHIEQFSQGMALDGGEICKPALLSHEPDWPAQPAARVVLREGMYHQIKRMFSQCGIQVLSLKRIAMGGVRLDPELPVGGCRELTAQELSAIELHEAVPQEVQRGIK